MVGKLYSTEDGRRDCGFTIFYMGINAGALIAPVLTGLLAEKVFGTSDMPVYKYVFIAAGIGMLISLVWFWFGRSQLKGIGAPPEDAQGLGRVLMVAVGMVVVIPLVYFLLSLGAVTLGWILLAMFVGLSLMLLVEGIRNGKVARDKVIAMLIIFAFNVLFWMFFEQAGSSFTFLADNIVDRDFGGWIFPTGWFQSVNSIAIIALAPVLAWALGQDGPRQPVDPAQVRPGPDLQRPGFPAADVRAVQPGQRCRQDPVLDAVHGLRDPVGRRVVPVADRPVDGDQAGAAAPGRLRHGRLVPVHRHRQQPVRASSPASVSGETGMTTALGADRLHLRLLVAAGCGVLLFLLAPLIQKLMHGVK